jgi:hypothetical protein
MLSIGVLFVRMLCDFFKPRRGWKPKSWYCGISSMSCSSARRAVDCICVGLTAPYSSGSIVTTRAFWMP